MDVLFSENPSGLPPHRYNGEQICVQTYRNRLVLWVTDVILIDFYRHNNSTSARRAIQRLDQLANIHYVVVTCTVVLDVVRSVFVVSI